MAYFSSYFGWATQPSQNQSFKKLDQEKENEPVVNTMVSMDQLVISEEYNPAASCQTNEAPVNKDFVLVEKEPETVARAMAPLERLVIAEEYSVGLHAIIERASLPFLQKREATDLLLATYPKMQVGSVLGEGAFSEARLFTYINEEGKQVTKVLKVSQFYKTSKERNGEVCFDLAEERIGGEWFAFLAKGEHIVQSDKAIYYNRKTYTFHIVDREKIQQMFDNPKERKGVCWTLVCSVSDYVEGSRTLSELIAEENKKIGIIPTQRVQKISSGILLGVVELHQVRQKGESLVHRDIKPDNILVTRNDEVKILDLGLSKMMGPALKRHSGVGTAPYTAPEALVVEGNSNGLIDSYAVGVSLFELVIGHLPFKSTSFFELYNEKMDGPPIASHPRLELPFLKTFKDLISNLTHPDPEQRVDAEQALDHAFFKGEVVHKQGR